MELQKSNSESAELLSQKFEQKYSSALMMFKSSEIIAGRKEPKEKKDEKTKSESNIISEKLTEVIDKLGLFSDEKQKKQFNSSLSEVTQTEESQKIFQHPFVQVLISMGIPLALKFFSKMKEENQTMEENLNA